MLRLIGISGKKLSGKDTLCRLLQQHYAGESVRLAFADPLKEEVAKAICRPIKWVEDNKADLRLLLQAWGTDFRRKHYGENYWVKQVIQKILALDEKVGLVVIPDVRFLSEAGSLRSAGATLIRIERPPAPIDIHPSEVELDNYEHFNYRVKNGGTVDDLSRQAAEILRQLNIPIKHHA